MSRYSECKQTLLTNTEYAKKKNINIAIFLFDDTVRLYTNVKLSDETNEIIQAFKNPIYSSSRVYDNLSYDQIIMYINESKPMGGTNFIAPFNLLEKIKEFDDSKNEIFFLSDGFNNTKLSKTNLEYLSRYKFNNN
jgi:sulfur relay (sulfurtransferase) complex TusBCD TusD component (DsrE family)